MYESPLKLSKQVWMPTFVAGVFLVLSFFSPPNPKMPFVVLLTCAGMSAGTQAVLVRRIERLEAGQRKTGVGAAGALHATE